MFYSHSIKEVKGIIADLGTSEGLAELFVRRRKDALSPSGLIHLHLSSQLFPELV